MSAPSFTESEAPYRARHYRSDSTVNPHFAQNVPWDPLRGTIDSGYCIDAPFWLPSGGTSNRISNAWARREEH
jgi:hypothetical protein